MSPEHRAILERMRSSAGVVRRAVEAAPPGRFSQPPREGEWSALETLIHLRDVVVHVYGLRIRRLLYEEAPVFADFDEEGYRRASLARGEAVGGLLDTIVAEHEQLARLLQALPDADWPRQGRHPSLGVMSIEFLARRVGEHAEEHAAQIAEATRQATVPAYSGCSRRAEGEMVVERKGFDQQSPKNPNDLGERTRTILHQRAHHVPRRPTRKARLRPRR